MSASSVISLIENGRASWVRKVIDWNSVSVHFVMQVSGDRIVITHFVCLGIMHPLSGIEQQKGFAALKPIYRVYSCPRQQQLQSPACPDLLLFIKTAGIAIGQLVFPCLLVVNADPQYLTVLLRIYILRIYICFYIQHMHGIIATWPSLKKMKT